MHVSPHVLSVHVPRVFGCDVQFIVHEPQCIGSPVVGVSHPFARLPSQSPKPIEHVTPHMPALHAAVPFVGVGHVVPHIPQCCGSALRFVSQPFDAMPSQFPQPMSHCSPQVPPVHAGEA
jgi:hypothetical protein